MTRRERIMNWLSLLLIAQILSFLGVGVIFYITYMFEIIDIQDFFAKLPLLIILVTLSGA